MHQSRIFFIVDDDTVQELPQALYVQVVRGKMLMPTHAGREVRTADWYVRKDDSDEIVVVNETYSTLAFDSQGRIDLPRCSCLPTDDSMERGTASDVDEARRRDSETSDPAKRNEPRATTSAAGTPKENSWTPTREEWQRIRALL